MLKLAALRRACDEGTGGRRCSSERGSGALQHSRCALPAASGGAAQASRRFKALSIYGKGTFTIYSTLDLRHGFGLRAAALSSCHEVGCFQCLS